MKYYVVSEEELMALENISVDAYVNPSTRMHRELDKAYNNCRARPVTRGEFDSMGETISAWEEE